MSECPFCGKLVNQDDETKYELVQSWVTGPKLDHPILRQRQRVYAHNECIKREQQGQSVDQLTLEL